jgi:predicted GH43/DUF377 family glycosyl hydrolase
MAEKLPAMNDAADLFTRYHGNPVLTPIAWPGPPVNAVFNPGATRLGDETLLLVRVEDLSGLSHIAAARSLDGLRDFEIDPDPVLSPHSDHPEEAAGVEDPRITRLEDGRFVIAYTAFSAVGPLVSLAVTEDFRSVRRLGPVLPPYNKDAALFPVKVGGRWAMLHRPSTNEGAFGYHVWICFSPDLVHWGDHRPVILAGPVGRWDAGHIGLGPPPIRTDEGWLVIYHGVRKTVSGAIYRVGLALLDLEDPSVLTHRSPQWVMGPAEPYERGGDVPNVVFPTGFTRDGDALRLYYGAADSTVCVADASVSALVEHVRRHTER